MSPDGDTPRLQFRLDVQRFRRQLRRNLRGRRVAERGAASPHRWSGDRAPSAPARDRSCDPRHGRRRLRCPSVRPERRSLVDAVAVIGYERSSGNRWVRALSGERAATVDLVVPSYGSRMRAAVQVGSTNSPEVGGLAEALHRPAVRAVADATLMDGNIVTLGVALLDLASLPCLKLHARRVRSVDRDAIDLWVCLELLAAAGKTAIFGDAYFEAVRGQLALEFADGGPLMGVVATLVSDSEVARHSPRIRGLVSAVSSTN